MARMVKCFYCGKVFDRDKEPFMPIPNKRRFAHRECYNKVYKVNEQEEADKEKLYKYVNKLFNYQVIPDKVEKQIQQFISEKNYTYVGILKALKYFYEVKHGDKEKAHGLLGIVPFVYEDAHLYYIAILETQQKNKEILLNQNQNNNNQENIIIPVKEIHIESPIKKPMRKQRRLFSFLEDDK